MTRRRHREVEPWNQRTVDETPVEETVYWLALDEAQVRKLLAGKLPKAVETSLRAMLAWIEEDVSPEARKAAGL